MISFQTRAECPECIPGIIIVEANRDLTRQRIRLRCSSPVCDYEEIYPPEYSTMMSTDGNSLNKVITGEVLEGGGIGWNADR